MYRIQQESGLEELPRPCDVFDLAGGTSTGGYDITFVFEHLITSSLRLIVLMLFRLRMSVDEAIHAYARLAKHVFSAQKWFFKDGKFKASRLEEAIVTVIQEALKIDEMESRSIRMLDEKAAKWYVLLHLSSHPLLIRITVLFVRCLQGIPVFPLFSVPGFRSRTRPTTALSSKQLEQQVLLLISSRPSNSESQSSRCISTAVSVVTILLNMSLTRRRPSSPTALFRLSPHLEQVQQTSLDLIEPTHSKGYYQRI